MATTLVVATWIVTVSATRYADYSNVKMPQYGGNEYDSSRDAVGRLAVDDYQSHSVDAPASLDYKYEEERGEDNVKSEESVKLPEETLMWQKLSRKHISTRSPETNTLESLDSYSLEFDNIPKIRSNHRNKQWPRSKHRSYKRDKDVPKRHKTKYGHDQNDNDVDEREYFRIDKDIGVYKSKKIDDDEITYVRKHTTERIIRRKPRDRYVKSPPEADTELEELAANRRMKGAGRDYNYKLENDDTRDLSVIPNRAPQERYRPVIDEVEEHPPSVSHRSYSKDKGKTYDDYNDYYDMKRVYNIKNKLPALLRRTTVRESSTSARPLRLEDSFRRIIKSSDTTMDSTTSSTTKSTESTTSITTLTATTSKASTKSVAVNLMGLDQLSLAEKSRLSILRKAQRKEGVKDKSTNKPPVLLQVTKKMVTVVVVEPGTSQRPWMRVRELSEDSPETIKQVKLLMRKKLIAEAKDMDTLNEDWDQIICDYVDMSLIKTSSNAVENHASAVVVVFFILLVCIVQ